MTNGGGVLSPCAGQTNGKKRVEHEYYDGVCLWCGRTAREVKKERAADYAARKRRSRAGRVHLPGNG